MKENSFKKGLWPVMLTPFHENNEVDYEGLVELTEFYISNGAKGLFSNCLSSEIFQLTDEERLKILSTVVQAASGAGIEVVSGGTFISNMSNSADDIKRIYDKGAAAVVLITNQLAEAEDEQHVFKRNLEELVNSTGSIPLGIYECPYPYKRLVSPEEVKWIAAAERFFYMKDTSCNPRMIEEKVKILRGSNCLLYNANTATALQSLEMGAAGLSPIGANFYPEFYSYLTERYFEHGNDEQLRKLSNHLTVMEGIAMKCYPFSAKIFLKSRGVRMTSQCRIVHDYMTAEDYLNLAALEVNYRLIAEELKIYQPGA